MYRKAELGVGLNPKAKFVGDPLMDEGVLETAHIALGLNYTCARDGKPLLKDGELIKVNEEG